jgi:hypothetical protein
MSYDRTGLSGRDQSVQVQKGIGFSDAKHKYCIHARGVWNPGQGRVSNIHPENGDCIHK